MDFLRLRQIVINRETRLEFACRKTRDPRENVVLVWVRSSRIIGVRNQCQELLRDWTETTWIDPATRKLLSRNIAVDPKTAPGRYQGRVVGPGLWHIDRNLL